MSGNNETPYRPTVRYASVYKDYVNQLFHATTLDRSQLIRAALFTAAHSPEFRKQVEAYAKVDVPVPRPTWSLTDTALWLEQSPQPKEEGRDVIDASNHRGTGDNRTAAEGDRAQEADTKKGRVRSIFRGGLTLKL